MLLLSSTVQHARKMFSKKMNRTISKKIKETMFVCASFKDKKILQQSQVLVLMFFLKLVAISTMR